MYLLHEGDIIESARSSTIIRYRSVQIDAQAAAKVARAKLRMELGNTSNVKWFAGIGEYIIDWGPGYRIYLAKDGESLIVLFGGGTKKRQQADIDRAQALHAEYKARKAPGPDGHKAKKRKR